MQSQALGQTPRIIPVPSRHPRRSSLLFRDESEAEQWSRVGLSEQLPEEQTQPGISEWHHLHLRLPRAMVGFKTCLSDLNPVQSKKHRDWARVAPVDGQLGAGFLLLLHAQELSVLLFDLSGP